MRLIAVDRRRVWAMTVGCVVSMATVAWLAGCGEDSADTASGGAGRSAPAGATPAAQPYDIIHGDKLALIEYAQMLLQFKCMDKAGYPQNLKAMPDKPSDGFADIRVSASTFGATSDDEARRLGFGQDSMGEPPRIISYDASYDRALERCGKEADAALGPNVAATVSAYYDLVNKLAPYRGEVNASVEIATAMADCIETAGYKFSREQFIKTPQPQLLGVEFGSLAIGEEERWQPREKLGTVQVGPAIPPRKYTPTPEEAKLAVEWRHCQVQTGAVQHLLERSYEVQRRYLDRYEDQFTELNPKLDELAKKAADLVAAEK